MAEKESKHQKFQRLAENRTNKIIEMVDILGNLSNRGAYEFSDEEVKRIFQAIEKSLNETKKKFQVELNKEKQFKL